MTKEQIYARLDELNEKTILTTDETIEYSSLILALEKLKDIE